MVKAWEQEYVHAATCDNLILVPSCPHPPRQRMSGGDLNFLSLTLSHPESEMSNEIAERIIKTRYVIKVQNGRLDFIPQF